jgi:hypothetical protein
VRELSSAELSAWMAYYQIDPWGEQRADLRNAIGVQILAETHRDKSRGQPFTLADFMPYPPQKARRQSTTKEALRAGMRRLVNTTKKS